MEEILCFSLLIKMRNCSCEPRLETKTSPCQCAHAITVRSKQMNVAPQPDLIGGSPNQWRHPGIETSVCKKLTAPSANSNNYLVSLELATPRDNIPYPNFCPPHLIVQTDLSHSVCSYQALKSFIFVTLFPPLNNQEAQLYQSATDHSNHCKTHCIHTFSIYQDKTRLFCSL